MRTFVRQKTDCYDTETSPRLFVRRYAGRFLRTAGTEARGVRRQPGDFREAHDRPDGVRPRGRLCR